MTQLYKNIYRIPSANLQYWNYANEGIYFITICTKNRKYYFGDIVRRDAMLGVSNLTNEENAMLGVSNLTNEMNVMPGVSADNISNTDAMPGVSTSFLQPTEIGKIAHLEWHKTKEIRSDMNLELGEFIVMPNHIHVIIIIGSNNFNNRRDAMLGVSANNILNTNAMLGVSANNISNIDAMTGVSTNNDTNGIFSNQFAPQSKNLASIIRGYKSAVTTFARKNKIEFDWQPRFHEHIIRSESSHKKISNYIINNHILWKDDKFHNTA